MLGWSNNLLPGPLAIAPLDIHGARVNIVVHVAATMLLSGSHNSRTGSLANASIDVHGAPINVVVHVSPIWRRRLTRLTVSQQVDERGRIQANRGA
ncbi:hypothetical protein D3M59_10495 [Sphingomonas edaphi]|uniref:Uncharacterized protein n=1 Tax=Sphingomonas edaphi TaxID=2315689 RepID=A0A418PYA9_9SPHN|nr:hypothetical protein D3M59_10495 [Sphingomonas edaphi]